MSNNPDFVERAVEQKPVQNNWNANEFGLRPKNLVETISANFSKVFSYLFGWDVNNLIWRAIRTDVAGNLLVANGAQAVNAPSITNFAVTGTSQQLLAYNPLRRSFAIYNDGYNTDGIVAALILTYPSPTGNYQLNLPAGSLYEDDSWQGAVFIKAQNDDFAQDVTVIEYF